MSTNENGWAGVWLDLQANKSWCPIQASRWLVWDQDKLANATITHDARELTIK